MIKFLLDQGLPRTTVGALASLDIAAEHVGDMGMAASTDSEILQVARDRGATVVTLDADFHVLLAAAGVSTPSVIRLRIEGLKSEQVAEILHQLLAVARSELEAGAAMSVTGTGVRIRMLPLV